MLIVLITSLRKNRVIFLMAMMRPIKKQSKHLSKQSRELSKETDWCIQYSQKRRWAAQNHVKTPATANITEIVCNPILEYFRYQWRKFQLFLNFLIGQCYQSHQFYLVITSKLLYKVILFCVTCVKWILRRCMCNCVWILKKPYKTDTSLRWTL